MIITLPEKVKYIIETLENSGFEAYAVGGCVRDAMLGREPNDWDITTSALPMQVKSLFRRTIDTGIVHGTVTVMLDKDGFEVTTYRLDGEYEDARHPKEVSFTASLEEDLKRRDFTINAMAYNETDGLVDLFGGKEDLDNHVIRCVGCAKERFSEDALRILRAFRFSAQLDFSVEEETMQAAEELASTLSRISAERICAELTKLLVSEHPERLVTAYRLGITKVILPEFDRMYATEQRHPAHYENVALHCIDVTKAVTRENRYAPDGAFTENEFRMLRFAAMFHDIGKPDCKTTDEAGLDHFHGHGACGAELAKRVLQRLKTDNLTMDTVKRLVQHHDCVIQTDKKSVRRAIHRIGGDLFPMLFALREADLLMHNEPYKTKGIDQFHVLWELYLEILEEGECTSLKDLAVTGSDLIAAGFEPGKELGEILKGLLEAVLERPELNQKELLLELAKEYHRKNQGF